MTKRQLIAWSAARESLDLILVGQIPVLSTVLDIPILIMHFCYAGPAALITLLEMIPVVGFFPVFTAAAIAYPHRDNGTAAVAPAGVTQYVPSNQLLLSTPVEQPETLYRVVNGHLVPVETTDLSQSDEARHGVRQIESRVISQ